MKVLVYAESWNGSFKKSTFEAIHYAAEVAKLMNAETVALSISATENPAQLGKYGAQIIKTIENAALESFDTQTYAEAIIAVADEMGADTIIISNTNNGKAIAPLVAAKRKAALISNVIELPESISPFTIKRKTFSSKAIAKYQTHSGKKVITITANAFGYAEGDSSASVESFDFTPQETIPSLTSLSVDSATGKIGLTEADLVVSAGRGLKGPENWGMVEELADALGAATACSKPVSDIGWRPHSEHVGQTGIAINPQLYIAVGISGAIQHLAGVNASKNIVVINTDPDAPFFKAADYGIVGDAFEVLPKLISAIKSHKASI